ncbi:hypothetical protein Tsubulata_004399 [Turnera subulata]|uniref:GOLD domain-containing protein n=1 Tax=Turnera subulata TaxID=218843 RepID=A0A9Q0J5D5_9ROSI|nr:hypothetical protein Tsubulata_004399 [Turnera subulata]
MGSGNYIPLFHSERAKGRVLYRLFAATVLVGICLIWAYRVSHIPRAGENGRWVWIGLLGAELWFGFYWIITQALRWKLIYRTTFKDRLSQRYEKDLPGVDIFVCTADPVIEPPLMVVNTVLSAMAYNYPPERLAVYVSDDAGSILTFYALMEASQFARHWIPYCKKFNVEPRSAAAYFASVQNPHGDDDHTTHFEGVKNLYEEMKDRIESAARLGRIPEEVHLKHKGFSQWDSYTSKGDHDTILQILIDGKDPLAKDIDGWALPILVYLAREKRPHHFHNFKAGAMNALIRISSNISNGQIILNVDCDMYSNDSLSIRDALCFFMDEGKGSDIAFVQFPQWFENLTKNDLYSNRLLVVTNVEFHGIDGYGGPLYVGTGCFHRRETLCGLKFNKNHKFDWKIRDNVRNRQQNVQDLEAETKPLASCTYEQNTQWGNEMGLKYGCPVEDVITGLSIQCNGWKSAYYNPERKAFLGAAATSLPEVLVQHKRWSEGDLQIFLSKYSPAWFAHGKISLGLQLGYACYCLWAPNCFAILYYSIIPSLHLLKGHSLFPQISSPWFLPFAYVILAECLYSLVEFHLAGGTILGWWNEQRIWLYKRSSSYLFASIDTILKFLGFANSGFIISTKVADGEVLQRYKKEIMEFGSSSPMLTILATIALLNLFCLVGVVKTITLDRRSIGRLGETMPLQILLSGVLVFINLPLFQGLFFRSDKGKYGRLAHNYLCIITDVHRYINHEQLAIGEEEVRWIKSINLVLELERSPLFKSGTPSNSTPEMGTGLRELFVIVLLAVLSSPQAVLGIRFVIDREECFSHDIKYEGDTVHVSFVVIKVDSSWQYSNDGVDLVIKGPSGEQIQDFRDKTSEKFDFMARNRGVHRFCFTNKSPYHETIDFDVHVAHFSYYDEHAKDEHFKPLMEQISKLEDALYNIQFEQHWLEAQTDRQAIVNEAMSRRAIHKAFYESAALVGASVLQVYLLRRLFERKLGMSRV